MSRLGSIRIGPPPPTRRGFSIRAKVVTLLLAPLAPLLVMTIFTVAIADAPARNLSNARTGLEVAGNPISLVIDQLQNERLLSVQLVSDSGGDARIADQLATARHATDAAVAGLTTSTSENRFKNTASDATTALLAKAQTALGDLASGRRSVDQRETRFNVITYYNGVIDPMFRLYRSIASVDDHILAARAAAMLAMAYAGEAWSQEDAMVIGAATAANVTSRDYSEIVGAVAIQRQMYAEAAAGMSTVDHATYKDLTSTPKARSLRALEDSIVSHPSVVGSALKIDPTVWQDDFNTTFLSLQDLGSRMVQRSIDDTSNAATSRTTRLWLITVACILMLLVLVFFSWRVARNLLRRVTRLRAEALTLALDRLPSVVERIRVGQPVDVDIEVPPLAPGADELGQLSEAFTRVQQVAIASAVHEATLREGFNQVFLNIARRSQTLLHRQLALLDAMERRSTDPEELEELFRVDHLATRMRRHAEDLVILAGSTPGRGWRSPVAVADVLRAAASEVEEYARINVVVPPQLAIVGRAVNDIVHLLAELLENATLFSPPDSQVTLSAQVVPNGLAIEVEDRGLGMTTEDIDGANARLAAPPDFDPQHSARLGLFVVAKLAERQGIRAALRRSPYGGITAVALIPSGLVVTPGAAHADAIEGDVLHGDVVQGDVLQGDVVRDAINGRSPAHSPALALAGAPTRAQRPERPERRDSPGTSRTVDGLPIRIRQATVARALPDNADDAAQAPAAAPSRTPEQMRNMLASFQSGMTKGRQDAVSEIAGDALGGSTQPYSGGLAPANGHVTEDVFGGTNAGSEARPATPSAGGTPAGRLDEPPDLPPLPQRTGRHGQPAAAPEDETPVKGSGVTAVRTTEPRSTVEDGRPSAPKGGGNDDN